MSQSSASRPGDHPAPRGSPEDDCREGGAETTGAHVFREEEPTALVVLHFSGAGGIGVRTPGQKPVRRCGFGLAPGGDAPTVGARCCQVGTLVVEADRLDGSPSGLPRNGEAESDPAVVLLSGWQEPRLLPSKTEVDSYARSPFDGAMTVRAKRLTASAGLVLTLAHGGSLGAAPGDHVVAGTVVFDTGEATAVLHVAAYEVKDEPIESGGTALWRSSPVAPEVRVTFTCVSVRDGFEIGHALFASGIGSDGGTYYVAIHQEWILPDVSGWVSPSPDPDMPCGAPRVVKLGIGWVEFVI